MTGPASNLAIPLDSDGVGSVDDLRSRSLEEKHISDLKRESTGPLVAFFISNSRTKQGSCLAAKGLALEMPTKTTTDIS